MKAILLAAGFATRLYPLTQTRAKPLLEIGGKPMLTRLVGQLSAIAEIDEFVAIGNEKFARDFEAWRQSCPSRAPIRVLNDGSTDDSNKLGAVGDLQFALSQMPEDCDLVVVAGDNLFEFDPAPIHADFKRGGLPLLLVRRIEDRGLKSRYNEVILGEGGIVERFREKPPDSKSDLAAICFYFFPPGVKAKIDRYLAEGGNPDAPGYFIQWLVQHEPVRAVQFGGTWFDIGNLETLEAARKRYES